MRLCGYYAILDVLPGDADVRPGDAADPSAPISRAVLDVLIGRAKARLAAGPCCMQLRGKGLQAADLASLARALLVETRAVGVPLCVNDRLDVALAVGAQAVHLGQEDLPLAEARRIATGRLSIGISTHDAKQAEAAARGGADYVGFGPVFATSSKAHPDRQVGVAELRGVVAAVGIPVVAIGGITTENVGAVARAGATAAAVIAGVDTAADPEAAARVIQRAFR